MINLDVEMFAVPLKETNLQNSFPLAARGSMSSRSRTERNVHCIARLTR
jgi:hypothetical protein